MIRSAIYVSVWDGGTQIQTPCRFNTSNRIVSHIVAAENVEGLNHLDEQYVLVDGQRYDTFETDDGRCIVEGQEVENE